MNQPLASLLDVEPSLKINRRQSFKESSDKLEEGERGRSSSKLSGTGHQHVNNDDVDDEEEHDGHHKQHVKELIDESLDFEDLESIMWRKVGEGTPLLSCSRIVTLYSILIRHKTSETNHT